MVSPMRLLLAFGESEGQLHFLILECNHTHTHTHMHTHTHTHTSDERAEDWWCHPCNKGWPCIKQVSYINLSADLHSSDNFAQIHTHTLTQEISVSPSPRYYLISCSHTHLSQPNQRPTISLPLPLFKPTYLSTYTSSPGLWTVTPLHKRGSWQRQDSSNSIGWPRTGLVSTLSWGQRERGVCVLL